MVTYPLLLRLGSGTAIAAGTLRIASALMPVSIHGDQVELLYFVIDLLLLFAIVTLYAYLYDRIGWLGFFGFVIALSGVGMIVGPDGYLYGVDLYVVGASLLSIGLALLSGTSWLRQALPRWICVTWLISTGVGIGGYAIGGSPWLMTVAGITFGIGFIGAGFQIRRV